MDAYPLEDFWKIPSAFLEKKALGLTLAPPCKMSLRPLVTRTFGHSISQPARLISPPAELLIRAFTDEGEFHAEVSISWLVAVEPTPSSF